MERKCQRCLKESVNGHDACIANLPGVKFACCGHGKEGHGGGYIMFENGIAIYGDFKVFKTDIVEKGYITKLQYMNRPDDQETYLKMLQEKNK